MRLFARVCKICKNSNVQPEFNCCSQPNVSKIIAKTSFILKGGNWYKDGYSGSTAN